MEGWIFGLCTTYHHVAIRLVDVHGEEELPPGVAAVQLREDEPQLVVVRACWRFVCDSYGKSVRRLWWCMTAEA